MGAAHDESHNLAKNGRKGEKKSLLTFYQKYTLVNIATGSVSEYNHCRCTVRHVGDVLPKIHCSDRHLVPSGFLPLYSPMQMLAWRTLLHTAPPHSWMSSVRLWQGGWDSDDTNMSGCSWNRSCWCSPAERCCCNRQIYGTRNSREKGRHLKQIFVSRDLISRDKNSTEL